MEKENEKQLKEYVVTDAQGKEYKVKVLFIGENEERGRKYIFFYDPKSPDEIIPMILNEDYSLDDIEDEEEYKEVEEIFNSHMENLEDEEDEEEK